MRLVVFLFAVFFVGLNCVATPRKKRVTVEYTYHIPPSMSPDEAREIAIDRAREQAIADEFGTVVTQSASININVSGEDTSTDFLSIGGSELRGEWIETIGKPKLEYITDGEEIALKVEITGLIREIEGSRVPFEARVLRNGITDNHESDIFSHGDDIYVSFISPSAGYLAIYLIDSEKTSFCLLPYQEQETGIFQVKANHRYVFFHPDSAEGVDKRIVEELIADTSSPKERNRILAIFSPNKFFKASDNRTQVDLPRNLNYANFQKWLANVKKKDIDLSVIEKAILIVRE